MSGKTKKAMSQEKLSALVKKHRKTLENIERTLNQIIPRCLESESMIKGLDNFLHDLNQQVQGALIVQAARIENLEKNSLGKALDQEQIEKLSKDYYNRKQEEAREKEESKIIKPAEKKIIVP